MIPIIVVEKGDIINIERDLKIRILFPTNELIEENVLNNNSVVTKLEYKNFLCYLQEILRKLQRRNY